MSEDELTELTTERFERASAEMEAKESAKKEDTNAQPPADAAE